MSVKPEQILSKNRGSIPIRYNRRFSEHQTEKVNPDVHK